MRSVNNQSSTARSSGLDSFFKISERGSTVGREIRGGLVTFLTMAYIIVLNPLILGFVPDSEGQFPGGGMEPGSGIPAIAAATASSEERRVGQVCGSPCRSRGALCTSKNTPKTNMLSINK